MKALSKQPGFVSNTVRPRKKVKWNPPPLMNGDEDKVNEDLGFKSPPLHPSTKDSDQVISFSFVPTVSDTLSQVVGSPIPFAYQKVTASVSQLETVEASGPLNPAGSLDTCTPKLQHKNEMDTDKEEASETEMAQDKEWFDPQLYIEGRKFAWNYFALIVLSSMASQSPQNATMCSFGFVTGYSFLRPIAMSLQRIFTWLLSDLTDPNSQGIQYIKECKERYKDPIAAIENTVPGAGCVPKGCYQLASGICDGITTLDKTGLTSNLLTLPGNILTQSALIFEHFNLFGFLWIQPVCLRHISMKGLKAYMQQCAVIGHAIGIPDVCNLALHPDPEGYRDLASSLVPCLCWDSDKPNSLTFLTLRETGGDLASSVWESMSVMDKFGFHLVFTGIEVYLKVAAVRSLCNWIVYCLGKGLIHFYKETTTPMVE